MCPSKVLGPNVAHAMFFQRYWYIVGDETVNICLQVLNEGRDVVMLNNTLISLIPKVNNPKGIEEYRSIILCIVIYKIIAKAMINRLKSILFGIISPTQSVSVPGRLNTDNLVIGFECTHFINWKKVGREGLRQGGISIPSTRDNKVGL